MPRIFFIINNIIITICSFFLIVSFLLNLLFIIFIALVITFILFGLSLLSGILHVSPYRHMFHQFDLFHFIAFSPTSSSSPRLFRNVEEFGVKKYFTYHRTVNKILLYVAIKGNFSGLFFFLISCSGGEFLRVYLIKIANCLFSYY